MLPPKRHLVKLYIEQQPKAARSCGFGERDRRVIDPPPILSIKVYENDWSVPKGEERKGRELSLQEIKDSDRFSTAVIHVTIWDETEQREMSLMPEEYNVQQRRLMGTTANTAFLSNNPDGYYFHFSDLSCRTAGRFKLRFTLVIPFHDPSRPFAPCPFEDVIFSDTFQVYNAKDFPGMQASTWLARRLKDQGCLISIKKGITASGSKGGRRRRSGFDDSEDGDSGGDEEDCEAEKSRKKQKKSG
jgi:hypothetical protein